MKKRIPFLLGFILLVLAVWLQVTHIQDVRHWIGRLENLAYDMQLRADLFTKHRPQLQTSITIVDIDDISLVKEGRWPWPRSKLAALVDRLQAAGAVVIVFDMLFPQTEENIANIVFQKMMQEKLATPEMQTLTQKILPFFDNDAKFALSLSKGDNVVGVSFLPQKKMEGVLSQPLLKLTSAEEKNLDFFQAEGAIGPNSIIATAAKNVGFINVFPDEDGVIRRVPLLIRYQDGLYPSLALEAVRVYLLSNIKLITAMYSDTVRLEGIQMGNNVIPTDEKAQVIIPFRGKGYTFPYFSATDVLQQKVPADAFTGKIIFVGATAIGLGDLKSTSVEGLFPGIEINATIADGILKNNFPSEPVWALGAEIFITVILGMILLFIFPYLGPRILTICIIVIPIVLIVANDWLNDEKGIILSVFMPIMLSIVLAITNMVYGYLFETRKREHLKEMFGQYVPEGHIDEMLKSSGNYGLHGDDREMTVLFADIRNFTTLSEPLTATQLKELLNEFFTPMTEIIFKHRGTIDKYVGDLIMAFWGAPLKDKRHATHALAAALEMQKEVGRLKKIFLERQVPEINIGIGLNSGMMSVGDMGSKFRRNYTVLGDAVNLASRVESLTKYYDAKIMTTENTRQHQEKFVFRLLDQVRVKGKKTGIAIYEVLCWKKELTQNLEEELALHHHALAAYFNQRFDQAEVEFSELHRKYPDRKLYPLYLDRIAEFKINPPPIDWDGVYTHVKK